MKVYICTYMVIFFSEVFITHELFGCNLRNKCPTILFGATRHIKPNHDRKAVGKLSALFSPPGFSFLTSASVEVQPCMLQE